MKYSHHKSLCKLCNPFHNPTISFPKINLKGNSNSSAFPVISHKEFSSPKLCFKFMKKNPTRRNNVSKFYYSIFIWSSTCFGRHTAHHQEPKTALAASGFSYMESCWMCSWWTLSGDTPPIIRSLKLHWQPLVFHTWKVVRCVVGGRCQATHRPSSGA